MFNNNTWLKYQELIGQKVKSLEELYIVLSNQELSKGMTLKKDAWAQSRYNAIGGLQKRFIAQAKFTANEINKIVTEGLKYSIDKSNLVAVDKKVLQANKNVLVSSISVMKDNVSKDLNLLINTAIHDYRAVIPKVQLDSRDLFTVIQERVQKSSDLGYVVTQSGKQWTFKSYMEMSVRTEMQNNALKNLEESSKAAGIKIYLASSHGDCADDHVDFQGLYYLADGVEWKEEYSKYNFHPKYKYLSEAKALGFLTRPNCRHYVQPILESQLGDKGLAEKLGMPHNKASEKQYNDLKQQRYNERNIRKYKNRVLNNETALKNATEENKALIRNKIASDKSKVREWQKQQRKLISNSNLKRDYGRENPGIVVNDFGASRK